MNKYHDNKDLLNSCEVALESFCKTVDGIISLPQKDITIDDYIDDIKSHHKVEIDSIKSKLNVILESVTGQMHTLNTSVCSLDDNIANKVTASVSNAAMQSIIGQLDTINKKSKTGKERGTEAEGLLYTMLSNRLLERDGYNISMVSGISHSCDIMVERMGYPTIRIESKAIGIDRNVKVPKVDVEKFKRDLIHTNNHGIMVSLHSGIVGIGKTEVTQLSNGKFAVYLSNNEYDIDIIVDMMHVIYKIDNAIKSTNSIDGVVVRNDDIARMRTYILDCVNKIQSAKNHLKESMRVLSDVHLEILERTIMGNSDGIANSTELAPTGLTCKICNKTLMSKQGYTGHVMRCKTKNTDVIV
jgi:hypothetical protein